MNEDHGCGYKCGVSLACCDVVLREQLAGFRTAADVTQNAIRDSAAIRLELAQAELRASERLAAHAAVAAAAACKTDALITSTACQTQREIADCCCKTEALIRAESDRNREMIQRAHAHRLEEALERCQGQMAAYFTAKVPPVIPTCGGGC